MTAYLIIGDGSAGMAAAQAIRQRDQDGTLTVISDDPQPYYYRAALTNYLLGQLRDEQLWGVPPDFYSRHRIGRFFGRVTAIDTAGARVVLDNGLSVPYDRLLIASGAAPVTLDVPGADLPGVMTFRTLQDVRRIVDLVPDLRQAVIVGGGPLGLEWVQGLRRFGVQVTYILRERRILERFLDADASELVFRRLRSAGVTLLIEDEIAAIHPPAPGAGAATAAAGGVAGVTTKGGRRILCQLVGVAIGARPRIEFLRTSQLLVDRGVVTDRHLRTSVANVFAAGDVAHVRDAQHGINAPPVGLWQPARRQGQVAGANMSSPTPMQSYAPGATQHVTHLYDLDFAAVGELTPRGEGKVDVLVARPSPESYRKVVLHGGRVAGAMLLGDRDGVRDFKRLVDLGLDVSAIRDRLLDPHFDLTGWIHRQQVVRTPQPARLSRMAAPPVLASAPLMRAPAPAAGVMHGPPPEAAPGRQRRLAARLVADGNVYPLPADRAALVGRDASCDVALGNISVSRRHADVLVSAGGYALRDLGSANGTWVGLTRLQPNVPQGLHSGDVVRLGEVSLTFELGDEQRRAVTTGRDAALLIGPNGPASIGPEVTSIGRDLASDIVVPSTKASRLHAQIRRVAGGALFLNDMGSMNGTVVNGARIVDAHCLADGDVITIGDVPFTFRSAAPAAPVPAGVLVALTGGAAGTRFPLVHDEVVLGRDLADDIPLNDPLVSRRHAVIRRSGGRFVVEDLGSRNGTRIDGTPLAGPHRLSPEEVIQIGQTRFVFRQESRPTVESPLPPEGPTSILSAAALDAAMERTTQERLLRQRAVPVLVLESGAGQGLRYPFAAGERAIIGRDEASTIVLRDDAVSRQHAQIEVMADGRAVLTDLASRNGTVVNGEPLSAPRTLQDGDRIAIGGQVLRFTWLE